jgi:hypothetical protein
MSSSRLQVGCQICQMLAICHRKRAALCSRLGCSSRVDSELPRALADLCDHRIGIVGGTQPCHWQGGCPQRTSTKSFPSLPVSFRLLGPGPGSVGSLIPSESSLRLAPLHAEAAQYWAYVPYRAGLEFTLGIPGPPVEPEHHRSGTGRSQSLPVPGCQCQRGPGGKVGGACVSARVAQLELQAAHCQCERGGWYQPLSRLRGRPESPRVGRREAASGVRGTVLDSMGARQLGGRPGRRPALPR